MWIVVVLPVPNAPTGHRAMATRIAEQRCALLIMSACPLYRLLMRRRVRRRIRRP